MTRPDQSGKALGLNLLRLLPGILFAAALALAPQPAFAQHGGGAGGGHSGGGGGGHSGGGGGHSSGGGHASGGSRGGSSAVSHGGGAAAHGTSSASTPANSSTANSTAISTGSRVWGGSEIGSGAKAAPSEHFAGSNNTWQDPPSSSAASRASSGQMLRVGPNTFYASGNRSAAPPATMNSKAPLAGSPRATVPGRTLTSPLHGPFAEILPTPPHIGPGRPIGRRFHPPIFFNGCFGGFFPGFCGSGFGFFFGPSFWGPGCDPFWSWGWGCNGFGLGYSYGPGYNYGSGDTDAFSGGSQFTVQADTMSSSQEDGPFTWQNSPASNSGQGAAAPIPVTMLYFKDGSSYGVTDYWLANGNLHYITTYGGENSVRADQLDLQRTVDENAKNGVDFVLRPAAPAAPQK